MKAHYLTAESSALQIEPNTNEGSRLHIPLRPSPEEEGHLASCEETLQRGLATFFEVGNALLKIRDLRLYRFSHGTFEAYCHERWNIGRTYAWRVIAAAERLKLLPQEPSGPRPVNEFQMRPFLKLEPEAFPRAWEAVVAKAKNGRITSTLIRGLLSEIAPEVKAPRKRKRSCAPIYSRRFPVGEILVLLHETKRKIERHELEKAIETIDRIESLMFLKPLSPDGTRKAV